MRDLVEEKRRACELAKELLQSNENYLDRVIESDTDHLPTTKVRELCSKAWQAKADTEVAQCISFYKQKVSEACNEILAKHGNA